jgi:hypothetical protein
MNYINSTNVTEQNINNVVLPFDEHSSTERDIVNIDNNYLNEPYIFTKKPPRKQNPWSDPGEGNINSLEENKGCKMRYSNGQNVFGKVCGDINYKNSDWVRGNVFSNKYPYKLHHKTKIIPQVKIIRNNPVIKKDSPYWPEPKTYKNIKMYDHKSYPDPRNTNRDESGKPLFRYPYNPTNPINLNNGKTIEGFDIKNIKNNDCDMCCRYLIATVLILVSFRILFKKF